METDDIIMGTYLTVTSDRAGLGWGLQFVSRAHTANVYVMFSPDMVYEISGYSERVGRNNGCEHQLVSLVILVSGTGEPSPILLTNVIVDSSALNLTFDSITVDTDHKATAMADPVGIEQGSVADITHLTYALYSSLPRPLVI